MRRQRDSRPTSEATGSDWELTQRNAELEARWRSASLPPLHRCAQQQLVARSGGTAEDRRCCCDEASSVQRRVGVTAHRSAPLSSPRTGGLRVVARSCLSAATCSLSSSLLHPPRHCFLRRWCCCPPDRMVAHVSHAGRVHSAPAWALHSTRDQLPAPCPPHRNHTKHRTAQRRQQVQSSEQGCALSTELQCRFCRCAPDLSRPFDDGLRFSIACSRHPLGLHLLLSSVCSSRVEMQ